MINSDDYIEENKTELNLKWPYSRSSIQNTHCRWFRIMKNNCIIEFNKQSTRY